MPVHTVYQTSVDSTVRVLSLSRFCPDFPEIKKAVRCLSVRPDKDETELSGLSVSFFVDVCFKAGYTDFKADGSMFHRFRAIDWISPNSIRLW